jgi:amino acid adenylation domain-containing protein
LVSEQAPTMSGDVSRLSPYQSRIWLADRMAGGPVYNIALGWRIFGRLDVDALAHAVDSVIARHESLRIRIESRDGDFIQRVVPHRPSALACETPAIPAAPGLRPSADDTARCIDRIASDEARRAIDPCIEAPFRAKLIRFADDDQALLLTMHHVAVDGWSMGVLARDLSAAYEAAATGRAPPPPLQGRLADVVLAEQAARDAAATSSHDYWRGLLAQPHEPIGLPFDRPAPQVATGAGSSVPFELDAAMSDRMRRVASAAGCSMFMLLSAALLALHHRFGGRRRQRLGYPVARRRGRSMDDLVGCFVNSAVLCVAVTGDEPFAALLARVKQACAEAAPHRDLPLDECVPPGERQQAPFEVMLNVSRHDAPAIHLRGLETRALPRRSLGAPYALSWFVTEGSDGRFRGRLEFDSDRFDPETALQVIDRFVTLLAGLLDDPNTRIERLPLLDPAAMRAVLAQTSEPPLAASPLPHRMFEAQARRAPGAVALACEGERLTYAQVDGQADRLAAGLRARGVGSEVIVGVCVQRGPFAPIAMLAVLKAGGVYLPLDIHAPWARQLSILEDAGVRVVVADRAQASHLAGRLPGAIAVVELDAPVDTPPGCNDGVQGDAETAAYCIYTSGSTGRPKGVVVPLGALAAHVRAAVEAYGLAPEDRVLQFASTTFDTSIEQVLATWCSGGTLCVRGEGLWSADELAALIVAERVTVADVPLTYWQLLQASPRREQLARSLRLLIVGGEAIALGSQGMRRLEVRTLNAYGPTETTVTCTLADMAQAQAGVGPFVPIGRPLAGTRIVIVDEQLRLLPRGLAGEICVAGNRLARGYLGRPDATAASFVPDPFGAPGSRMYRTGDLGRLLHDGSIEFLGRRDDQVKVRGVRIELGEVESALVAHPAVRAAAAVTGGQGADSHLVACVLPEPGQSVDALLAHLRATLPQSMIPSAWLLVDAIPMTVNGKVDRKALAEMARTGATPLVDAAAPSAPPEEAPATETGTGGILSGLLGIANSLAPLQALSADTPWFDAGFHSLLLIRLAAKLREHFGIDVRVRELMRARTPRGAAALVK